MMIAQKIQIHCFAVGPRLQLMPHAGCPEMGVANRLLEAGLLYLQTNGFQTQSRSLDA